MIFHAVKMTISMVWSYRHSKNIYFTELIFKCDKIMALPAKNVLLSVKTSSFEKLNVFKHPEILARFLQNLTPDVGHSYWECVQIWSLYYLSTSFPICRLSNNLPKSCRSYVLTNLLCWPSQVQSTIYRIFPTTRKSKYKKNKIQNWTTNVTQYILRFFQTLKIN